MITVEEIVLDRSTNVVLSYLDSGAPSLSSYETLILIHGNSFSNAIFKRLLPFSTQFNIRLIALSRRGFAGSTPLDPSEQELLLENGDTQAAASEETKEKFLELRAVEILQFINAFIQRTGIPIISDDDSAPGGRKGGLALLGWSLGSVFSIAAVAHMDSSHVSDEMRNQFGRYLRAHIMLEPGLTNIGISLPPDAWIPLRDPNIPLFARGPLFSHLVTGYFDYSKETISERDASAIFRSIVPSLFPPPTIYSFSQPEHDEIITFTKESSTDLNLSKVLQPQLRKTYLKACYDEKLRFGNEALRNMRAVWEVVGDRTYSLIFPALWEIEKDDITAGGGEKGKFMRFKVMKGANHFMHWDQPEKTMQVLREILNAS